MGHARSRHKLPSLHSWVSTIYAQIGGTHISRDDFTSSIALIILKINNLLGPRFRLYNVHTHDNFVLLLLFYFIRAARLLIVMSLVDPGPPFSSLSRE